MVLSTHWYESFGANPPYSVRAHLEGLGLAREEVAILKATPYGKEILALLFESKPDTTFDNDEPPEG